MALACLFSLVLVASASASSTQVTIAQDDRALLTDARQAETLEAFRATGVDWVRVNVRWDAYAPEPDSTSKPGFDDRDPNAYNDAAFLRLDRALNGIRARGMQVLLTPTGPGPRWASAGRRSRLWKPSPTMFRNFVHAVGLRYNGSFSPQGGDGVQPRVTRWSIWNEPNQPAWLQPQFERGRAFAPHHYRSLFRSARSGLGTSGHSRDTVLLGETAPLGDSGRSSRSKMPPGRFIRELLCVGSRDSRCRRRFTRLSASGFSHHPYVKFKSQKPTSRPRNRDEFPVGATSRLISLLDRAGRAGRIRRGIGVYMTEFGWQTNPPDRLLGVSPARQAQYINESERNLFYNGRVRAYGQYLLFDDAAIGEFQTGLRYADGRTKPAFNAFHTAFVVKGVSRRTLGFWGHLRSAGSGQRVSLQYASGRTYRTVRTLRTNARGYVVTTRPRRSGRWRLLWTDSSGQRHSSRVAGS